MAVISSQADLLDTLNSLWNAMVGFLWYLAALLAVSGRSGDVVAGQYLLGLGASLFPFSSLFFRWLK
ncbi:uncharacterized protein BT62DRAFT_937467 [Guyanagaster necrorhizus]|uniref:Uncharacterized protein n=1 Tax=Guyanagaster necrorhizus TaxID=856835 RepID=A0A9P8AMR5_9AGAR|nr:uncharacterized protein BT62DRAFT_937467 [Guyanagaster necrorhizus MCA 3950]KAG7441034.1 hypothetical protein BT62DRAFT_937467 [Guyanagaster necrorhizus MCA 3950]